MPVDWEKAWKGFFGGVSSGAKRYGEGILEQRKEEARREYEQGEYERRKKIEQKYATDKWKLEQEAKNRRALFDYATDPKTPPRGREAAFSLYEAKDPFAPEHKHLFNIIRNSLTISKPVPEKPKQTMSYIKFLIAEKYLRGDDLTEREDKILFAPSPLDMVMQGYMPMGNLGWGQTGTKKSKEEWDKEFGR